MCMYKKGIFLLFLEYACRVPTGKRPKFTTVVKIKREPNTHESPCKVQMNRKSLGSC